MKKSILNYKNVCAFLGVILALTIGWGANAQGADRSLAEWKGIQKIELIEKDTEAKDEAVYTELDLDLAEELPSVTFIDKEGNVVAVLIGNKGVLQSIYADKFANSYYLTTSGIHEFFLIK